MKVTNEVLAMFPVKGKAILADLMKRIELKNSDMDDHPLEVSVLEKVLSQGLHCLYWND